MLGQREVKLNFKETSKRLTPDWYTIRVNKDLAVQTRSIIIIPFPNDHFTWTKEPDCMKAIWPRPAPIPDACLEQVYCGFKSNEFGSKQSQRHIRVQM